MASTRKRPALLWYTGDWLKDPHLSMCSPATRGIWMDALCMMHENGESGTITGTIIGLARACRCSPEELESALAELELSGVCPPIVRSNSGGSHKTVTLVNRRMTREAEMRKSGRYRKMRERDRKRTGRSRDCHEIVTPPLSVTYSVTVPPNPPEGGAPAVLKGLELYENDTDLLDRWGLLWGRWTEAFPGLDLATQILLAHEYEMDQPPQKRKKSKARFLTNWFKNAVEFAKRDAAASRSGSDELTEEEIMARLPPSERKSYERQARREEEKRLAAQKAKGESDGPEAKKEKIPQETEEENRPASES